MEVLFVQLYCIALMTVWQKVFVIPARLMWKCYSDKINFYSRFLDSY